MMLFMLIGAIVAVELRGLLSSVIATGAVGLGLCIMFLFLRAPDLAITQLVVEILILVVLIRATIGWGVSRIQNRSSVWIFVTFFMFASAVLVVTHQALTELPAFGGAAMRVSDFYVKNALSKTGAANIVSSVILDFRAFDTLGEATVLFTAVISVMTLLRPKGRKKADERDELNS